MVDLRGARRALRYWPLAAAFGLLIAVARIAATLYMMREAPYYDQWAAIDGIAVARAVQAFDPRYLLLPHNEHLMVWTKLLDWLQLAAADNQYDPRPVGVLLAVLSALTAGLLLAGGACHLQKGRLAWLCAGLALAAIPYSWESLSMTWNDAFSFLIAGTAATLWLAATGTRKHAPVLLAAAILAALTMGSGWVAPAIGIGVVACRAASRDLSTGAAIALALPQIAAAALAFVLLAGGMHSGNARPPDPALALLQVLLLTAAFAPTWAMLWQLVADARIEATDAAAAQGRRVDLFVAALAVWGYLHVVSMIVLRSDFRLWLPVSRYMDVIAVAIMADLACLLRLTEGGIGRPLVRIAVPAVALFAAATVLASPIPLHYLRWQADRLSGAEALIAAAVRADDATVITRSEPSALPYPDPAYLQQRLADGNVRHVLGDRLGDRPEPAAFVRASRVAERWLTDHAILLCVLAAVLAAALIAVATGTRRRRAKRVGTPP